MSARNRDLPELERLAKMLMDARLLELQSAQQEMRKTKGEIADLRARIQDATVEEGAAPMSAREAWVNWARDEIAGKNRALALRAVELETLTAAARRAFGRHSALRELQKQSASSRAR